MVSWKCPVQEEVALGADAAEGVWAQAQQRSRLRAVLPTSRSVAKTQFFHRIADRLGERLAGSFEAIRGHSPPPDRRHRRHSRDPRAGVVTVGWAVDAPCTTMTLP